MKKIMAVYDVDSRYADRFAEFANQREQVPFKVVAFTSLEKLREFSKREQIDLLLIGDGVTEKELEGIQAVQTVRLSETGVAKEGEAVVYKYQASDSLLREVMSWYQPQEIPTLMTVGGRRSQIIGVYSPVGRCGKSSFAFTLGQVLAREEKVLYMTLEEFSGLSALTGTAYTGGLSDLLYYYTQREYSPVRLGSVTYNWGGLDYIPPVTYAEDKTGIRQEVFAGLIQKIAADGAYEKLILDVGVFCARGRGASWHLRCGVCAGKRRCGVYRKAGGMERVPEAVRTERIVGKTALFTAAGTGAVHEPGNLSGTAFVE